MQNYQAIAAALLITAAAFASRAGAQENAGDKMWTSGPWTYAVRADAMTDKKDFFAIDRSSGDDDAVLMVQCNAEGKFIVEMTYRRGFPFSIGSRPRMNYRFDKESADAIALAQISDDALALDLDKANAFLGALFGHGNLVTRISSTDGHQHDFTFDLSASEPVKSFLTKSCHLDL